MKHFHSGLVFGNITQEQFNSFVDTMSLEPCAKKLNFDRDVKTVEGDIEVEKDSEQSYIYVTYDFDDLTAAKYRVLNNIFNSSSGICYELLRDKYGLVYSFYVDIMFYLKKLYFYSEIDYSKKEKFLETLDEIIETSRYYGCAFPSKILDNIVGVTPKIYVYVPKSPHLAHVKRGIEIKDFLDNHYWDSYVILDDDTDMIDEQFKYFVHVSSDIGLSNDNVEQAIKLLNKDPKTIYR
jgi:hypothetical protein